MLSTQCDNPSLETAGYLPEGLIQICHQRIVNPMDLRPADVDVHDIAHTLAREPRFHSHVNVEHYSVAEHSIRLSYLVPPEYAFIALHHDDTETYLRDLPRPVKRRPELAFYREVEKKAWEAISWHFNLPLEVPQIVRDLDVRLTIHEGREFLGDLDSRAWGKTDHIPSFDMPILTPMTRKQAQKAYLKRHVELEKRWLYQDYKPFQMTLATRGIHLECPF